jgi:fructokinase
MTAVTPGRALVVGEALVDVTRRADGSVVEHPGGSPLNVAVTLGRSGIDTTLGSQVGDDRFGALVRAHLTASGVKLVDAGPPGRTASATATLDSDGAASYEFDLHWDPAELPDPSDFDVVHVGSIGAWMPPGSAAVADLVRRAAALGVAVSFDPNLRPSLAPEREPLRQQVLDIAGHSRFVKLSDEDAAVLVGDDRDPEETLLELASRGPGLVALTRGGRPAVLRSGEHRVEVAAPRITVVDTIGAGDTWMGALLGALLLRGWAGRTSFAPEELRALGEVAVTSAAITCSRPGADPPWHGEGLAG